MEYLWVGLGGFVGANARYLVGKAVTDRVGAVFPYGTLVVNMVGAFLVGVVLTLLSERLVEDRFWRQLTVVGFLGGFTTFSAYTFEAVALLEAGRVGAALRYVVGSNLLGLLLCVAGVAFARSLLR